MQLVLTCIKAAAQGAAHCGREVASAVTALCGRQSIHPTGGEGAVPRVQPASTQPHAASRPLRAQTPVRHAASARPVSPASPGEVQSAAKRDALLARVHGVISARDDAGEFTKHFNAVLRDATDPAVPLHAADLGAVLVALADTLKPSSQPFVNAFDSLLNVLEGMDGQRHKPGAGGQPASDVDHHWLDVAKRDVCQALLQCCNAGDVFNGDDRITTLNRLHGVAQRIQAASLRQDTIALVGNREFATFYAAFLSAVRHTVPLKSPHQASRLAKLATGINALGRRSDDGFRLMLEALDELGCPLRSGGPKVTPVPEARVLDKARLQLIKVLHVELRRNALVPAATKEVWFGRMYDLIERFEEAKVIEQVAAELPLDDMADGRDMSGGYPYARLISFVCSHESLISDGAKATAVFELMTTLMHMQGGVDVAGDAARLSGLARSMRDDALRSDLAAQLVLRCRQLPGNAVPASVRQAVAQLAAGANQGARQF